MALNHGKTGAAGARSKELAQLLGIREAQTADRRLSGRLKVIAKLKAARRVEIARGRSGSWLYDVNRHLNLCTALRLEYESLAAYFAENAGDDLRAETGRATPLHRASPALTGKTE